MKIRQATPLDAKAVKSAHYHAYQVNYKGYLPDDYLNKMPFDEDIISRTANYIQEHEYYVAEYNNRVIGFASCEYPDDKTVEIMALYIHPDFQKQGAGSALIKEICRLKKEIGYKKIVLWTLQNGPSLGFYQKQGFTQTTGISAKFWKCNLPIIQFEKEL